MLWPQLLRSISNCVVRYKVVSVYCILISTDKSSGNKEDFKFKWDLMWQKSFLNLIKLPFYQYNLCLYIFFNLFRFPPHFHHTPTTNNTALTIALLQLLQLPPLQKLSPQPPPPLHHHNHHHNNHHHHNQQNRNQQQNHTTITFIRY